MESLHNLQDNQERSNVFAGAAWMVIITLLLFFLPAVNGLIGGMVGGYKVGSVSRALFAALLPALVTGVALWVIFIPLGVPVVGLLAGTALGMVIALSELSLFVGAAIGGYFGGRSTRRTLTVG
jgi:hypothetical protein